MQKYKNLLWKIETECEKWDFKKTKTFDLEKKLLQSGFYQNSESKYLTGFWIEEDTGNNSFVFEKGSKLFVPPLEFVGGNCNCPLQIGKNIVFRDKDEKSDLIESVGLENFVLTQGEKTGLPIYIVDNHNWVFYAWAEWQKIINYELYPSSEYKQIRNYQKDKGQRPLGKDLGSSQETLNQHSEEDKKRPLLVHIDAHKDEGEVFLNKKFIQNNLSSVREQTAELKVSNYIFAAIQAGLIQDQFLSFTESNDFMDYEKKFELLKKDSQNIILNVDIDIFDSEVSLISLEEKVRLIGYFITRADLITFATSPGFIDQNLAIEITKIFLKYL